MKIEELKLKKIITLTDFELFANSSRQQGLSFVPDFISNIVADLAKVLNSKKAIVLNSNYG